MLDKKIGHRLVYIRGINLEFVVNNEGDNLTPVFDIFLVDGNVLKAGETQKTKNVLRSLRQEAKHFKAKGKRW
jgi:hypothetical protein